MFHLFKKLYAAFQLKRAVPARITIDDESIRLFQKEINECEVSLIESKKHLVRVVTGKIITKRKIDKQQENINNIKEMIRFKREEGDITTARQLAKKLLMLEAWVEGNQQQLAQLKHHERNILLVLKNTVNTLGHYRLELNIAKTVNMCGNTLGKAPELSSESISRMQQSLNRLRSRKNNSNTVYG